METYTFLIAWALLVLFGIIRLSSSDSTKRKDGRIMLMLGILLPLVVFLIGFAVCSIMK